MIAFRHNVRTQNFYKTGLGAFAVAAGMGLQGCDTLPPGATTTATRVVAPAGAPNAGQTLALDLPPVNGTPAVRELCKDPSCSSMAAATGDTEADRIHKTGTGIGNALSPFATLGAAAIVPAATGPAIAVESISGAVGQQRNQQNNLSNQGDNNTIKLNFNLQPIGVTRDGKLIRAVLPGYNVG